MAADKPQQEASTSAAKAAQDASKGEEDAKKTLPQLGALEEDDEFEEFEAEDWDDSEASLNQISTSIKGKADSANNGQANPGSNGSNDNLWEDNWDDDDIEDDFSVQLRKAISEQNGPQDMAT